MGNVRYINNVLSDIFYSIHSKLSDKIITCFLCGAKTNSDNVTGRDELRKYIDETSSDIKILYAEELFKNLVDIRSKNSLLDLENILAKDSQIVIIFLESPGSFVELGAFSNHEELSKKLLIIMDKQYKRDENFINLGPLKNLKRKNSAKSVMFFEKVDKKVILSDELKENIVGYIRKNNKKEYRTHNPKDLNSIIVMYYFLQIYLLFFEPISFKEILRHIKTLIKEDIQNIDSIIQSAIHLLKVEKYVNKDINGFYSVKKNKKAEMLDTLKKNRIKFDDKYIIDKLRVSVLNQKLRLQYEFYKDAYI